MNLPLLILRKDLRRYRLLALAAALLVFSETLAPLWSAGVPLSRTSNPNGFMAGLWNNGILGGLFKWPALFILVVAIVQEDLTVGDKAFWRTRPIEPRSLLSGKLLFLLAIVAVPAVAANLWIALTLDTPPPILLGVVVETTGFMVLAVLACALLAALTSQLMHAAFAALGGMLLVAILGAVREMLTPAISIRLPWDTDVAYPGPRVAFACALACAALVALLVHQYLTRRTRRTVGLLAVAVPAVLAIATTWTRGTAQSPIAARFPDQPLAPTPDLVIGVELPARVSGTNWVWNPATSRTRPESNIWLYADLKSAPIGRLFTLIAAQSSLRLNDGREPKLNSVFTAGNWRNLEREAVICRALGVEPPANRAAWTEDTWPQASTPIFSLPRKELAAIARQHGQLTVHFKIGEETIREEFRLPARAGATWKRNGEVFRLGESEIPDENLIFPLQHLRANTMLAPTGDGRSDEITDAFMGIFVVVVNHTRGEYAFARLGGTIRSLGIVTSLRSNIFASELRHAGKKIEGAHITAEWLAGAEIVFFRTVPIGKTEKTVVVDDFVVPPPETTAAPF